MGKAEDTKALLLCAARRIIDDEGVEAVSMRELGKKTQLSRGALYRHFRNKEELLASVAAEDFGMLQQDISAIIGKTDDPLAILESIMLTYYNFGISNQEHYRLMFSRDWDRVLYPGVHAAAFAAFEAVAAVIERALEQNKLNNKPARELAAISYAFIHGLIELNFAGHQEPEKSLDAPMTLITTFMDLMKA